MKDLTLGVVTGKNSVTFQIPGCDILGVTGSLNDENSFIIETKELTVKDLNGFFETLRDEAKSKMRIPYIIFIYIVLLCVSTVLFFTFSTRVLPITIAWVMVDIMNHFGFAKYIIMIIESYVNPDIKEMKKLHAANHMVFNAYNKLNRIPTVEEAKHFSKYTEKCSCVIKGRGFFMTVITLFLGSLIPTANDINLNMLFTVLYILVLILAFPIFKKLKQKGWDKYISFFALESPGEKELELVIKVVEETERIATNPAELLKDYNLDFSERLQKLLMEFILFTLKDMY